MVYWVKDYVQAQLRPFVYNPIALEKMHSKRIPRSFLGSSRDPVSTGLQGASISDDHCAYV